MNHNAFFLFDNNEIFVKLLFGLSIVTIFTINVGTQIVKRKLIKSLKNHSKDYSLIFD